jgi:hypothetical protein
MGRADLAVLCGHLHIFQRPVHRTSDHSRSISRFEHTYVVYNIYACFFEHSKDFTRHYATLLERRH